MHCTPVPELFLAKICFFFPQDMAPDIKSSWHETFACLARNETFRAFACLALACTHCTSNHCLSSKTQTSLIKLPKHSSCPTCSRHLYFWHYFSFRDSTITFIGEVLKTLTKHTNSFLVGDFLFVEWFVPALQMESFCLRSTTNWLFSNIDRRNSKPGICQEVGMMMDWIVDYLGKHVLDHLGKHTFRKCWKIWRHLL